MRTYAKEIRLEALQRARAFLVQDMDRAVKEFRTTTEEEDQKNCAFGS